MRSNVFGMGAILGLVSGSAYGASNTRDTCDAIAEVACGDGVRLVTAGRALPLDFGTSLTAERSEDWNDLWHYLGLPAPVPSIDFREEWVVAWIRREWCYMGDPVVRVCRDGGLELAFSGPLEPYCYGGGATIPEPRTMWVFAVSRRRLASALEGVSSDEASRSPLVSCDAEVNHAEISRRRLAAREQHRLSGWTDPLEWQASGGALGGVSPSRGGIVGAELRAGLRDDVRLGEADGFLGDLVGIDLRARWLVDPGTARPHFVTLGLWPWMMMSHDWVFHRFFSRQPTFMSLVIPEAGVVLSRGVGGYVAWSFPIMYRSKTYFHRTSPYVLDEHWAFELAPGVLWIFEQDGRSLTFTLTASAGLW